MLTIDDDLVNVVIANDHLELDDDVDDHVDEHPDDDEHEHEHPDEHCNLDHDLG